MNALLLASAVPEMGVAPGQGPVTGPAPIKTDLVPHSKRRPVHLPANAQVGKAPAQTAYRWSLEHQHRRADIEFLLRRCWLRSRVPVDFSSLRAIGRNAPSPKQSGHSTWEDELIGVEETPC
jgi:hypothetical protein